MVEQGESRAFFNLLHFTRLGHNALTIHADVTRSSW